MPSAKSTYTNMTAINITEAAAVDIPTPLAGKQ
jgi:hypothetical protein